VKAAGPCLHPLPQGARGQGKGRTGRGRLSIVRPALLARRAGVADRAEFRRQNLFETSLDGVTVVTMYLLPELNLELRPRLLAMPAGTRVVSHDWDMGDWQPDRTVEIDVPDKAIGHEKRSRVHLWVVSARVQGLWCGRGASLRIEQRLQRWSATLETKAQPLQPVLVQDGSIDAADGVTLRPVSDALPGLTLRAQVSRSRVVQLRVVAATGTAAAGAGKGDSFTRATAGTCSRPSDLQPSLPIAERPCGHDKCRPTRPRPPPSVQ
jgi:hypothetical protein